ncbi:MAG: VOC family protein [Rhodospirillaceae bacterium]|nr:VOC family protein [Rhodospirillaceae bacterium]
MLRVIIAAVVLFTAAGAEAANSVVRRTTLLVSDVKASVAFYEKIGFKPWLTTGGDRDPNSPTSLPLNGKPARSDFVIMAGRDPWIAMIGLLQYSKPGLPRTREIADTIGTGDAVLMIETDDIDGVYKDLQAMGAPMLQLPKEATTRSANEIKRVKNMFFRDPDGWVIEMSQVIATEPLPAEAK